MCDWRSAHAARLNLTPVRVSFDWRRHEEQNCRRCQGSMETVNHVINNCYSSRRDVVRRHNEIRDAFVDAISQKSDGSKRTTIQELATRHYSAEYPNTRGLDNRCQSVDRIDGVLQCQRTCHEGEVRLAETVFQYPWIPNDSEHPSLWCLGRPLAFVNDPLV